MDCYSPAGRILVRSLWKFAAFCSFPVAVALVALDKGTACLAVCWLCAPCCLLVSLCSASLALFWLLSCVVGALLSVLLCFACRACVRAAAMPIESLAFVCASAVHANCFTQRNDKRTSDALEERWSSDKLGR